MRRNQRANQIGAQIQIKTLNRYNSYLTTFRDRFLTFYYLVKPFSHLFKLQSTSYTTPDHSLSRHRYSTPCAR